MKSILFILFFSLTACTPADKTPPPQTQKTTNTQIVYETLEAYYKYPETFSKYSKDHLEGNKDKFAKCVKMVIPKLQNWKPTPTQCENLHPEIKPACLEGTIGADIVDSLEDLQSFLNGEEPAFWDIAISAKQQFEGDWIAMMDDYLNLVEPQLNCE